MALAAVAPTPLALHGRQPMAGGQAGHRGDASPRPARLASQAARPISDKRGTVEYRKHLAGVLTQRTLAIAVERARGSGHATH